MSRVRISELAEFARLETQFHDRFTEHIYLEAGHNGAQRRVIRKEHWEKCVQGHEIKVRAVKMIRKFKSQKPWESIDYTRELETVTKFSHPMYEPCLVKSFGWYENQEAVFIAMEYLTHGDLQTHLNLIARLSEPEARDISFQILEGLHYMHKHGFAHRDLKPANVLIKSMPPDHWWVKLCDFGISKNLKEGITDSTLKGTMQYMAPELLDPAKDSHSRNCQAADIWALGEIISRMLTGEPTFKSQPMLWRYVQKLEGFPLDRFRFYGIESYICEFIMGLMTALPEDRMISEKALQTGWMKIYETPSLKPPDCQSHDAMPFQKPVFLMDRSNVSESTSEWTAVSNLVYCSPASGSNSDGATKNSKHQSHPLPIRGVKTHSLGPFDLRQSRLPERSANNDQGQLGAEADPSLFYQRPTEPTFERSSKYLRADRRVTSPSNGRPTNTTDTQPSSTKTMDYEQSPSSGMSPREASPDRSSWNGTKLGPRPITPDHQMYNNLNRSPEMVKSPQSENFIAQEDIFFDPGLDLTSQETLRSHDSSLRASCFQNDSEVESASTYSLDVQASQSLLEQEKGPEWEREWEHKSERSSPKTAYRDQIRRDIDARRKRRKDATKHMVEQAAEDGDMKVQERAKMVELSGDAVFQFRLSIWFASLPSHQLHADVRDVLKRLNIIYAMTAQAYECWYAPASGPTENRHGGELSLRPKGGYSHFELMIWKKRAMVVVSDTYFRFKKLEGHIVDYEDLIERLVETFERNWWSKADYPTPW